MVAPNVLYRMRQPSDKGFDFLSSAEFMSAIFVEEPAAKPDDPHLPRGEWYCDNEDCDVREVRVNLKHLDGPAPKRPPCLKCPSCGQAMTFHHYLRGFALLPTPKVETPPGMSAEDYRVRDNCITQLRHTRRGVVEHRLANFVARIVEEIIVKTSGKRELLVAVEGTLHNGQPLPRVEVRWTRFRGMNWVISAWGAGAIVSAGKAAALAAAIQLLSTPTRRER